MKIKTAFVLLALVAFVGSLQSADAFGGAQNAQEARKKCRRDCKRMHSNPDRCLRFCGRRLTGQYYEEDYDDDADDVDDEDYLEDGLDLLERRLSRAQCRRDCKRPPWNGDARCFKICDGRRLSDDDEMEDVDDEPKTLLERRLSRAQCRRDCKRPPWNGDARCFKICDGRRLSDDDGLDLFERRLLTTGDCCLNAKGIRASIGKYGTCSNCPNGSRYSPSCKTTNRRCK